MNRYQEKRINGCLKRPAKLSPFEANFLISISGMPVTPWPKPDDHSLTDKQNHVLNQIAQKVGG